MSLENRQFDTGFNYQKVFLKGSLTQSVPATGGGPPPTPELVTITHNLGKIGSFRAWYDPALSKRIPVTGNLTSAIASNFVTMDAYLTDNTLVFSILNSSGSSKDVTFYYRIYFDAN